ncbi:MAG: hypothetical protein ACYC6A_16130 [Armatimonadota bacterium]
MNRRRIRRWLIVAVLLLLGCGGWIWWRSIQGNQTTLQAVARFPGDELGDLSVLGCMIFVGQGISVYDWDGRLRDHISAFGVAGRDSPPDYAWTADMFAYSWDTADSTAYAKLSTPYRRASPNATLARFSPDGQTIGCLAFQPRQLEVLVRQGGKTRWRRTFPVTPTGPITGRQTIDLLIGNDGRVILYFPQPDIIPQQGQSVPPATPIMAITERVVQTKNLQQPFQTLVAAYQRALMLQKSKPVITYPGRQHTPDGQYTLTFGLSTDDVPDIRWRRWYSEWLAGRERLTVTKGSGNVLMRYTARLWRNDDHAATILPFRDGEFQHSGAVYFSPDGSRLLFQGDIIDFSNEWAIYRY